MQTIEFEAEGFIFVLEGAEPADFGRHLRARFSHEGRTVILTEISESVLGISLQRSSFAEFKTALSTIWSGRVRPQLSRAILENRAWSTDKPLELRVLSHGTFTLPLP